ncbi:ABC transporter permease [Methylocapsa sp. S129]|uniref:ABC transporter permease n=1 Tax=Methylocapsa sp. S129 TaxID=1641869 RepID=UPI00131CCD84|nr:ABC transporter permease [Methylocapsa sp. S129]
MTAPDAIMGLDAAFWKATLGGALRLATPIVFAAVGETIVERSGTLNLGVDGMMTAGAFAAVVGASLAGWPFGLLLAALAGLALGLGMGAAVLKGGANQIVTGIAIALISVGMTTYAFQLWQPTGQTMPFVPLAPTIRIPFLSDIPFVGPVFFAQSVLTDAGLVLLAATLLALRFTRLGLVIKAAGDDPVAAALRGVDVVRTRLLALAFGGAMAGLGGAAITIGFLGSYSDGVTAGRGYIAIAVVIIGRWSPLGAVFGALLFAFFESLSLRLQGHANGLPSELYAMLPYAMTLIVLFLTARSRVGPRALAMPLRTEEG